MHVRLSNVNKIFRLGALAEVSTAWAALTGAPLRRLPAHSVHAVKDVTLEVREGERLGIVGRNGAGKTTLLQMIAGLAEPSSGEIAVDGRVDCIMTLGLGLRENCSGRENIYLDGESKGKTRAEIAKVVEQIAAFAELGEFIDYPVRTYSSGMKARLAFSTRVHFDPEILIIDEALSAGDMAFSRKATGRMKELCNRGKIVILVSHSMPAIVDLCQRCLWMDAGRIVKDGAPEEATAAYLEAVRAAEETQMQERFRTRLGGRVLRAGQQISEAEFVDGAGRPRMVFETGQEASLRLVVNAQRRIERPDLRVSFERTDGVLVAVNTASQDGFRCGPIEDEAVIEVSLGPLRLGRGVYEVLVELLDAGGGAASVVAERKAMLKVDNPRCAFADPAYLLSAEWRAEQIGPAPA